LDDLKLYEQFRDLCLSFPNLRLQRGGEGTWRIHGGLKFSRNYSGHHIEDEYYVKIIVSNKYPDELPKTFEIGNRIPQNFHHFLDDSLCLGAPLAVKQKFRKQPTLFGYVENCVIPYLYSFSYKCMYGKMPFGELSHGGVGILEYYQDLFGMKDRRRVLKMIGILAEGNYRGKDRCPCGSGKRLHSCHGRILSELQELQSAAEFLKEYQWIVRDLAQKAMSINSNRRIPST
jgi:hypothetical protein